MGNGGFFGFGFSFGIGVATLVMLACWWNGNDVVTCRWGCFLLGIAVAGVAAGLALEASSREEK